MDVRIPKGKYVVAVSGGVDSMALLDILAKQSTGNRLQVTDKKKKNSDLQPLTSNRELIVAHFNHGIRPDSQKDEEFVRQSAEKYKLPFEVGYGKLGSGASEERAREARYRFLNQVKQKNRAKAIITAHHQDDLIETALLNLMRGTGRRGLSAIADNPDITRPLLHLSKRDIEAYAKKHRLQWREDPSNYDERYLRNYIRRKIVAKLNDKQRRQFLHGIQKLGATNRTINQEIANLSHNLVKGKTIERAGFIGLPTEVAREVLMHFLRQNHIREFDKKTIERLAVAIKTAKVGTKHDVVRGAAFKLSASKAFLSSTD